MIDLTTDQKSFVNAAYKYYNKDILTRGEINSFYEKKGFKNPSWLKKDKYKVERGTYKLPLDNQPTENEKIMDTGESKKTEAAYVVSSLTGNIVPTKDSVFVPFGNYTDVKSIIASGKFYPIFITGLSVNGKTMSVTQACAQLKKELIRVNITIETDEDDLLGGFRLINGETKFVPGPVIQAMERGCTLLLDECDLGSNKLLALQPVLEGKGVFLKKINKWVTPKPGFNVIATANTKGKGSDDGRFVGTNILNEAFLERFAITIEQPYPSAKVEKKIILGSMTKYGKTDDKFAENLTVWAEVIRKTFYDGGVDEIISTRRLDHIVKAFSIFNDKMKAIELCVSRFDDDTKESFLDLYTKVDAGEDIHGMTDSDEDLDDPEENEDSEAVNY